MKAIIYRIFGRDIANEMMEFHVENDDIELKGFLGRPTLNRANRNFENYFVNNRYVKSKIISKAIEEGYQSYMMQHRYPFCVIHITVPTDSVDVNVHPTKMEVRFSNQNGVYRLISDNVSDFLKRQEMIPEATLGADKKPDKVNKKDMPKIEAPEPFEKERKVENILREDTGYNALPANKPSTTIPVYDKITSGFFVDNRKPLQHEATKAEAVQPKTTIPVYSKIIGTPVKEPDRHTTGVIKASEQVIVEKPEQLNFFDEKILTKEAKQEYRIVGQVFDTYWIVEYKDKMLMIDQHAAHEKVKYEQILKKVENNEIYTQTLTPPVVINVTPKEAALINNYEKYFKELGFEIEDFGMNAFAIRGVPLDLFGYNIKELFDEIITQMAESPVRGVPQIIREKIASMACKAAVKGNNSLSYDEADKLIEQLLELDNPYNCPHGRPTIISMSKYEVEKKFKRIV
jgi:DNA mismatch repair protein MutL